MKNIITAGLVLIASTAFANPYFRLVNLSHPQMVAGALLDPQNLGNSEGASLLPIFTHSPSDGCLLPSIVCENWSPLAIGASMKAGKVTLDVAPVANVLPWFQSAALAVIPDKFANVRSVLAPAPGNAVTFSAGPAWQYRQANNHGYLRIFTGLALYF